MLTLVDVTGARFECLSGDLSMPLRGNWQARVELGEQAPSAGPVTLELRRDNGGGVDVFAGTLRYGGDWQGRSEAVIIGGAGGLLTELPARHYAPKGHSIAAGVLLDDLAREAGEELDPGASVAGDVVQWTRVAATPARSLSLLADQFGQEWRVLDSGALWMGEDAYPEASPADLGYQTAERPEARCLEYRPDRATLRPGVNIGGKPVTRVVYRLGGAGVSLAAYYGASDRRELAEAVAGILPDPAYGHTYGATVVRQDGNLLELTVDDPRVATLRRVPLRSGLGGARSILRVGDRVRVSFENGSPSGAYAHSVDAADADGTMKGIARKDDTISCGHYRVTTSADLVAGVLVACAAGAPGAIEIAGAITGASSEALLRGDP